MRPTSTLRRWVGAAIVFPTLSLLILVDVNAREPSSSRPSGLSADFHRGVNYAHHHRPGRGYGSQVSIEELKNLRHLGVNWVALTPFGYQSNHLADSISGYKAGGESGFGEVDRTLTDRHVLAEIENAHMTGHKVALKPHIWSKDFWGGAQWHGTIDQRDPKDHERWWTSYRAFTLHYADVAHRGEVELYCIGTELVKMTRRKDEWRQLIEDVRQIYKGPLTYASHFDTELETIAFWDMLDFIGVAAYFPLDAPSEATIEQLTTAWLPHRKRLDRLSGKVQRPVLFMEVGYRPVVASHQKPWETQGGSIDNDAQKRAYEAMFLALADAEWWKGSYLWKAFTDHRLYERRRASFIFRNRPAESVIRRWYDGVGG